MPLPYPLECPPTPIIRTASLSSFLGQTRLLLLIFARDGCRSGRAYCTLHTSCSSTILFTVPSDKRTRDSAAVSPIFCGEVGRGTSKTTLHLQLVGKKQKKKTPKKPLTDSSLSEQWPLFYSSPQESRDGACAFIRPHCDIMT